MVESRGYDELVVVTGNVSNLVFDLLDAVRLRGLKARIVIADYPRAAPLARQRIFAGTDPYVRLAGASKVGAVAAGIAEWRRSRLRGGRPFLLLPGALHPSSVVGNALGFVEMIAQIKGADIPKAVFVTVATGTTVAGLALGAHAVRADGGPRVRIIGVGIDRAPLRLSALGVLRWTEHALRMPSHAPRDAFELVHCRDLSRFADIPSAVSDVCERVHEQYGLRIDPIFGGKTWLAMERVLRSDPSLSSSPVVFWHCGYTPEWRALAASFARRDST